MTSTFVILCTCPDADTAERLGRGLVAERLAACVNIVPRVRSIFSWDGDTQVEDEALMVIKTSKPRYRDVEAWVIENHPYDVPEVVALAAGQVHPGYEAWLTGAVDDST